MPPNNVSGLENSEYGSRWAAFKNTSVSTWKTIITDYGNKGVNTVRIPLDEASWLGYKCVDINSGASYTPNGSYYQSVVKQAVGNANAAALYVILDLHWGAPDNNGVATCPIGQPGFADADHS